MPGAIAKNAQEGTRSEYLAQYILSTFGTSIPVPNPEDSGIDLYCTLGYRIGRRFHVENNYLVQVKSNNNPIKYKDSTEVKWLLSHKHPFFICVINKDKGLLELYQTASLVLLSSNNKITSITIFPKEHKNTNYFSTHKKETEVNLYLGKPIVTISVPSFESKEVKENISKVIKSWVEFDQENIVLKPTGCTLYRILESWKTNEIIEQRKFILDFDANKLNEEELKKFDNMLFKQLALLAYKAGDEKNIELFKSIVAFLKTYHPKKGNTKYEGMGIGILGATIHDIALDLGINTGIKISKAR